MSMLSFLTIVIIIMSWCFAKFLGKDTPIESVFLLVYVFPRSNGARFINFPLLAFYRTVNTITNSANGRPGSPIFGGIDMVSHNKVGVTKPIYSLLLSTWVITIV